MKFNPNNLRTLVLFSMTIMVLLVSCEKEDTRKAVYAGVYDGTFIYHEFVPPFKVTILWDSLNYYGDGKDSIDLNLDGNYDLIISFHLLNYEAYINQYVKNLTFPFYCTLIFKNGLEITTQTESLSVHNYTILSIAWVDTLKYSDRIDNISSWSTGGAQMWWVYPSYLLSAGCWSNLSNSEMYIGMRMKNNSQYKYGWIKVNGISRENILFLSYALEK
jgi:hypothetical protein